MRIIENPFQQNSVNYCLELQIKFGYLQDFVQFFEGFSETIVYFEDEDTNHIDPKFEDLWKIEVYFEDMPDVLSFEQNILEIAKKHNIDAPKFKINEVMHKDWVSEVQKTFVPIEVDKFFIHSSDYHEQIPQEKIAIKINAGGAFGTGEHQTTANCLKALSMLRDKKYINCLDMGCGSGILAIAAAKLWPNQVTAVDIDEQAVLIAEENAHVNKVGFITVSQSQGYQSKLVNKNSPYQLITANILASPLIEMAQDAYNHLQREGILILAGFLNDQMRNVMDAHIAQGLKLVEIISDEQWPVLIMQK